MDCKWLSSENSTNSFRMAAKQRSRRAHSSGERLNGKTAEQLKSWLEAGGLKVK